MEGTAVERTSGIAGEQSLAERVNAYILTQHSSIHAVAKDCLLYTSPSPRDCS